MNEKQREAALRLIAELAGVHPLHPYVRMCGSAAALLRELLAEPQGEPVAWRSKERINGEFDSGWKLTSNEPPQTPRTIAIEPLYTHPPQQRKPLTTAMEAEIEGDCLVAWNASIYGHSAHDTVHPMFLSAFIRGYRAAERAHGIGEAP